MAAPPNSALKSHGQVVTMGPVQNRAGATTKPASSMISAPAPAASLIGMRLRRSRPSTAGSGTPEPGDITPGSADLQRGVADPGREPEAAAPRQPETPALGPRPAPRKPSDIIAYWSRLKNGRHFPSWSDLDSKLIADCWPNSLLLSCGAEAQRLTLESLFTEALRVESRGGGGNRAEGIDFTPMLTDWMLSLGREAERFGKPMQDTDALPSVSGEVRYRVIALPLSDDQKRIDHVLCHVDRA